MIIVGTADSLQIALATPSLVTPLRFACCYFDTYDNGATPSESVRTGELSTTAMALFPSPPAGVSRHLSSLYVVNRDTAAATVLISLNGVPLPDTALAAGDSLCYERTSGRFLSRDVAGIEKQVQPTASPVMSAVAAVSLVPGHAVYVDNVTGQFALASAASYPCSFLVGLSATTTAGGFVANLAIDSLMLSNWSAITGSAALQVGQTYFLGIAPGTLSTIAPSTVGQTRVVVGRALSTTQLLIQPSQPILL